MAPSRGASPTPTWFSPASWKHSLRMTTVPKILLRPQRPQPVLDIHYRKFHDFKFGNHDYKFRKLAH